MRHLLASWVILSMLVESVNVPGKHYLSDTMPELDDRARLTASLLGAASSAAFCADDWCPLRSFYTFTADTVTAEL